MTVALTKLFLLLVLFTACTGLHPVALFGALATGVALAVSLVVELFRFAK